MATTTLRRRTKAFDAALEAAKPGKVWCYALSNGFKATVVESFDRWTPRRELERFKFAKLSRSGNKITLHVHSNLWYEWDLSPSAPDQPSTKGLQDLMSW